jgi:rhodanese-related sulfurtransferase
MTAKRVDPAALREMLTDGGEIALLDVREADAFERGHLLRAIDLPLSGLARAVRPFVPRPATRIVLCDDGDGLADQAAAVLAEAGYGDLAVLDGGVEACAAAGFELFEYTYTMAHCFGLFVQEHYGTPRISGEALKAKVDAGEDLVIFDTRPFDEFHAATVPGAVNLPVVELITHIRDLAPDPGTQVVVHCGGKARGVLGCQSLINAGLENPVATIDEGIMDWFLACGMLDHGAARTAAPASDAARAWGAQAAERIAARFGVRTITPRQLEAWRSESETRTLFIVDVRSREEFEASHLPGSVWIPGGQLAGCTEDYIATRNARLCLIDDDGTRAALTASWMMQAGWPEVAVLEGGIAGQELVQGGEAPAAPEPEVAEAEPPGEEDAASLAASYRRTIAWRQGLLSQFKRDGTLTFRPPPAQ